MKRIEIFADPSSRATIAAIAEKFAAVDFRDCHRATDNQATFCLLITDTRVQAVLDTLQTVLGAQPYARILVLPVETILPRPPEEQQRREAKATAARDALYDMVAKDAHLDANFLVLVVLSTVVAAIGLIENDVAVVIGAMVIAPLLGPNLALGLGTALGDVVLIRQALTTTAAGIALATGLSLLIGWLWPFDPSGPELLARTGAGLHSVALALASGAAAALSLTTGLSSVLVGVMVAVALLPPTVTVGLTLSQGHGELAIGAGLLLAINLVCVNLATKLVLLAKGIRPRTFSEKIRARRTSLAYLFFWIASLVVLVMAIYGRQELTPGL